MIIIIRGTETKTKITMVGNLDKILKKDSTSPVATILTVLLGERTMVL